LLLVSLALLGEREDNLQLEEATEFIPFLGISICFRSLRGCFVF